MIEQIPQMGGETGTRAGSAVPGDILHFTDIPGFSMKSSELERFFSDRVKYSG